MLDFVKFIVVQFKRKFLIMSDRLRLSRLLATLALAGLLVASGAQAQGWWRWGGDYPPPGGRQGRQDRPPRQFDSGRPDRPPRQFNSDRDRPPPRQFDSDRPDRPPRQFDSDRSDRPPPRQFADPDRAANATRRATGGRVLGVQGVERDGRPGYRVRILQPDGRVRNFHFDPDSGVVRD